MAGPFYNNIKGTTAGAPGTGAFTPNAASAGFLAWSTVPTGWIGLVRFEDGSDWALTYSYWNGTTLSRSTNQHVSSSTGSVLSLTSAATAAMVADANRIGHPQNNAMRGAFAQPNTAVLTSQNMAAATVTGTAVASAISAGGSVFATQTKMQINSATTANAQAGVSRADIMGVTSSTAGAGGWEYTARFSYNQFPGSPRHFIGMTSVTMVGNTGEPSALVANVAALTKDSTDTNFQFLTNAAASGSGTKIDTGISPALAVAYEVRIWSEPGSTTVNMLLIAFDTGAIFYKSTSTDVPASGALLMPMCLSGLSASTGTAMQVFFSLMLVRLVV